MWWVIKRRPAPLLCAADLPRWRAWWNELFRRHPNTILADHLARCREDEEEFWLVPDDVLEKALLALEKIPGWQGPDAYGEPLAWRRLSPQEEHVFYHALPKDSQDFAANSLWSNPHAPRKARREAERTYRKNFHPKAKQSQRLKK